METFNMMDNLLLRWRKPFRVGPRRRGAAFLLLSNPSLTLGRPANKRKKRGKTMTDEQHSDTWLVPIESVIAAIEDYDPRSVKMSLADYVVVRCQGDQANPTGQATVHTTEEKA